MATADVRVEAASSVVQMVNATSTLANLGTSLDHCGLLGSTIHPN